MHRVYMPLPDTNEAEYLREWHANAPWRLAGMTFMMSSAVATSLLYIYLAKVTLSAFSG
ncbi:hypothetical protein [Rhizobium sp. MHM7A]|uniref:hypothetical protein n=1 Tax=Rhizobium sp. MHM7A TaxID=2583233 RepID=UPI00148641A6|nr:hypothetical protein [Rhizobium sp. MHM7A]